MRAFINIALSLAVAGAAMAVSARVIENPDYRMNSSMTFSISRVELSDTATRINADIYGLPGECIVVDNDFVLHGQASGNKYELRTIEGIPQDRKIYLPDSAYVSATFVFPPLHPADAVVDFIEVNAATPWDVSGLNLGQQPKGRIRTNISGSVTGRPDVSWLLLMPWGNDPRVNKFRIIPVRDGRFRYTLTTDEPVLYCLTKGPDELRGSMTLYGFFSEGKDVQVEIPADGKSDFGVCIAGGPLTQRFNNFIDSQNRYIAESKTYALRDSLEAARAMFTPEAYALKDILESGENIPEHTLDSLYQELDQLRNNDRLFTPAGKAAEADAQERAAKLSKELYAMESDFVRNDKTLVGLALIYNKMRYHTPNSRELLPVFADVYQKRFANHQYTKALSKFLGDEAVEPGYKVPYFTAPDLDGNVHKLSELIDGKVALVDLWASWCGPCREHSMAMIPVYEKWKDRGFTVVGIARENGDTDAMRKAIAKDGYPWLNLVELNDAGRIWERYGAATGGGRMVLVNPDGIVLSVDPTPQEVEVFLQELLKE